MNVTSYSNSSSRSSNNNTNSNNSSINNEVLINYRNLPLVVQKKILIFAWRDHYSLKWKLSLLLVNRSWFRMLASIENQIPILNISLENENLKEGIKRISNPFSISHYSRLCVTLVNNNIPPQFPRQLFLSLSVIRFCLYEYCEYKSLSSILNQIQQIEELQFNNNNNNCQIEIEVDDITNVDLFIELLSEIPPLKSLTLITELGSSDIKDNESSIKIIKCIQTYHTSLTEISLDLRGIPVVSRNILTDIVTTSCRLRHFAVNIEELGDHQLFNHLKQIKYLEKFFFGNTKTNVESNLLLLDYLVSNNTLTDIEISNPVCQDFIFRLFAKPNSSIRRAGLNVSNTISLSDTPNSNSNSNSNNYNYMSSNRNFINHKLKRLRFYVETDSSIPIVSNPLLYFPNLTGLYLWNINDIGNTMEIIKAASSSHSHYKLTRLEIFVGIENIEKLLTVIAQSCLVRVGLMVLNRDPLATIESMSKEIIINQNSTLCRFDLFRSYHPNPPTSNQVFDEIYGIDKYYIRCNRYPKLNK